MHSAKIKNLVKLPLGKLVLCTDSILEVYDSFYEFGFLLFAVDAH